MLKILILNQFFNPKHLGKKTPETLINPFMTLNNPKINSKTQNQFKSKKLLKLISIISGDGNVKKHLNGNSIIKWNLLKQKTTIYR